MRNDLAKLRAIVEASKKLTATLNLDELLNVILDVALDELEADRGTVFLKDEQSETIFSRIIRGDEIDEIRLPIGKGIAGTVVATGKTIIIDDAYNDDRFDAAFDKKTGYRTKSILCMPLKKGEEIVGAIQLLNHKRGNFTEEDAEYLGGLAAHMVIAIENARAHRAQLEQERTQRELELAANIQRGILPKKMPNPAGLEINAVYEPCRAVGGDVYQFFDLPDDRIVIVLADVSGKGVPAAMITTALDAYMHALIENYQGPAAFCTRLNNLLHRTTPQASYATFTIIEYHTGGTITYVNCGHLPTILKSDEGCRRLEATGTVLGLIPDARYEEKQVSLSNNDLLLLFTDGVTEAAKPGSDEDEPVEFGLKRVEMVCTGSDATTSEILAELHASIVDFTRGEPLEDDLTVLALQFQGR